MQSGKIITFINVANLKKILTSGSNFVDRAVGLSGGVSGNVIAQSDGSQRDEAVVERIQEVPIRLQVRKHASGHH